MTHDVAGPSVASAGSMQVYLCGPIHSQTAYECTHWRGIARSYIESAGHAVRDPMDRDFRGREEECSGEIVAGDLDDIEQSNVVLVNANRPGWGTAMEVLYAHQRGKRVVAFASHTNAPTLSPWLREHTEDVYESVHSACGAILSGSRSGIR